MNFEEELMITGMLWFDNDQKTTLANKIDRAAQYYKKKYGQAPDVCFVHPKMIELAASNKDLAAMEIKASETVLLHHFWIGRREIDKSGV
jgi:hypothetical protein